MNLPVLLPFIEADAFIPLADEASAGAMMAVRKAHGGSPACVRRLNCISGTLLGCACSLDAVRAYGLLGKRSRNDR